MFEHASLHCQRACCFCCTSIVIHLPVLIATNMKELCARIIVNNAVLAKADVGIVCQGAKNPRCGLSQCHRLLNRKVVLRRAVSIYLSIILITLSARWLVCLDHFDCLFSLFAKSPYN